MIAPVRRHDNIMYVIANNCYYYYCGALLVQYLQNANIFLQ